MDRFLEHDGRRFYQLALERPVDFGSPFGDAPYPCLVWDHDGEWDLQAREALTKALIASNCRYAVCGGARCERWHDDIDLAFLIMVPESESDQRFVMTSWHEGEAQLDVAWFFAWNTDFEDHHFRDLLVLEVGTPTEGSDLVQAVTRAVVDADAVVEELDGGVV